MKKSIKNIVISTAVAGFLVGCGGGGGGGASTGTTTNTGAGGGAQKGPFKEGQTVTATLLNADGSETTTVATTTTDALGKFAFASLSWSGPTEFKVEGEYLNESTGEYVAGGLLTAVTDVTAGTVPTVNINILTHIAAKNIKEQMSNNISISVATQSAKETIQETFNLKLDSNTDLEDLDLTDGSAGTNQAANTQLLKISAALSATEDPEKTLDNLAEDLKDGGIDDEAEVVFEELKTQEEQVDLADVAAKMESVIDVENVPSSDDLLAGTISLDNSIVFTDVLEAFKNTPYSTAEIIVKGIYGTSAANILITNGEFSTDGGSTWLTSGTISNGDTLILKATASDSFDTKVTASLDIGGTKFTYNVTTQSDPFVEDTKVKQLEFSNAQGQAVSTLVASNSVTIEGINTATDIFISDGSEYRINSGSWTNVAGTITNGDTLEVRHTTSSAFSTRVKTTVTFGLGDNQIQALFKSYTLAQDKTPKEFAIATTYDTALNSVIEFSPVAVEEITGNVKVSVLNGEYKIGTNGSWTSEVGTVSLNEQVYVRHTSSTLNNTKTSSALVIGTKIAEFVSYSEAIAEDTIPNEFDFTSQFNVSTSTTVTDSFTVVGINSATPISVVGGEYSLDSGSTWTSDAGTVNNNDTVQIRHTSSANNLEKKVSTLNVGGIISKLVSFTKPADDTTPNVFSFAIKNGVNVSSVEESESITIRGINASTAVSIVNGEFTTDGGTTWVTTGNVNDNATIKVRQTADSNTDTKKVSELTVGTFTTKFITVTKKPAPSITSTTPPSSVVNGATYEYQAVAENVTSWQITNKPEWAIFNTQTGELKGWPNKKSYEQDYSNITITAANDSAQTDVIGPFTITVTNATPVLTADTSNTSSITQGNSLLLKVKASDSLNETLTYSLDSSNSAEVLDFVQIDAQTGYITNSRTIVSGDIASHTIIAKVSDGTATSTVNLPLEVTQFVTTQADPELEGAPLTTIAEGNLYSFTPIANDVNGDTLTFAVANNPSWLNIDSSTGTLSGTPSGSDVGTVQNIIITVEDGNGGQDTLGPFNITVTNVNDTPVGITIPDTSVEQGKTLTYDIKSYFSDADGDSLTYYAFDITDGESTPKPLPYGVTFVNGVLSGTPGQEAVGENMKVRVFAVDSSGAKSTPVTFTVSVTNVNDAPTLKTPISNKVVNEDESFTYDIKSNFEDLDGDSLTYSAKLIVGGNLLDLPSELSFTDGVFGGTFTNEGVGRKLIEVTATDGTLNVKEIFEIIVENTNDAPVLENTIPKKVVNEDALFNFDVKPHFKDVDVGDTLTFTATVGNGDPLPSGLTFVNGVFSGTPDNDAVGTETITVTAKDSAEAEVVATFDIEVVNTNDAPVVKTSMPDIEATEDSASTPYDVKVHFEDVDVSDSLSYDVTFANGTLLPNWISFENGILVVNATNEHVGVHMMKLTATDLKGEKVVEEFKITVVNVNDAPVGSNDVASVVTGNSVLIDVLSNDTDVDVNDTLTIKAGSVSTPSNGTAEIIDGKIKYTPSSDYLGEDTFTYVTKDSAGVETSAITVTVNVTDILLDKAFVLNKKLVNNNETYIFREHDIVLADLAADEFTEFLTYEDAAEGKIKVQFRNGEYDLISKSANGFTIEFFEFVNGSIQLKETEVTSNDLVSFEQSDLDTAFDDIQEAKVHSFNTEWIEKRYSAKYNVSGNKVIKDSNSDALFINAYNLANGESRAEARTLLLDDAKTIVKSEIQLIEANEYSKAQVMSVMEELNIANETIYATITIKDDAIYYYAGKYDANGDNELVKYSPDSSVIANLDTTVSSNNAFKFSTKVEVVGTVIKFNVAKIDGTTGAIIEEYAEKTVDVSDDTLDLGFDRVQYRAKTVIPDGVTMPTEITKLNLHYFEAKAGENLSTAVQDAIAKIESIDIETEDIDTKLGEANALLANETSPDAMLAKTLLSVTEIANKPEIASLLTIDVPDGMSTTSYLNQYIRSTVLDTINIKDNFADDSEFDLSTTTTNTLHEVASKLKTISNDLGVLFDEPTKAYDYDGSSMNYEQSLAFRAVLLAVAFKLENLSAYQYGTNADFKTRIHTEGSTEFEYNNIKIDPASVLNSGNFFKLVNGERVNTAKSYLSEALTHALKLPVGFEEELTQEDKDDAKKIKDALDGVTDSLVLNIEDDAKVQSMSIDIASLFSSTGALDIGDFGSEWENKCDNQYTLVSESYAKIRNDLLCEYNNGNYIDTHTSNPKQKVLPTTSSSNIDDIVLNITKVGGTELVGQEMLDFIFEKGANEIKASELVGKKIVNGSETYYFKANNEVVIGDTGSDHTSFATYSEIEDGKIKVLFDNGEYDVISKSDDYYSVVFFEYNSSNVLVESPSESLTEPIEYSESDSDYSDALADVPADTNMVAVDPYIYGAQMCYDENTNNVCDTNEQRSSLSDENGVFTFSPGLEEFSKIIMVKAGMHNGENFTGMLKGQTGGSNVLSPSTTLVENGFTKSNVVSLLATAGITISEDDLFADPMAGFSGSSTPTTDDYAKIQTAIAIHTFLTMTNNYGLTYNDVYSAGVMQEPYASLFPAIATVIKSGVNPDNVQNGATPKMIVDVGVAISNYLTKKYISSNNDISVLSNYPSGDMSTHIATLAEKYATTSDKFFRIDDSGMVVEIIDNIEAFGYTWKNPNEYYDSNFLISGNIAEKDTDGNIVVTAQNEVGTKSKAQGKTYFDDRKFMIKSTLSLKEMNSLSQGKFTAEMRDINSLDERIYATVGFKTDKIYFYAAKYDSTVSTKKEEYIATEIAALNPLSLDDSVRFDVKIEVINSTIKVDVSKVNASGDVLEAYTQNEVTISDASLDLGIDAVQLRAESDLTSESSAPTEITKLKVYSFESNAGTELTQATKDAIAELENLNLETQDIDTALTTAKNTLDTEISTNDSADAKVAKTLIRIAEIANSSAVSDVLSITSPVGVSDVNYLNQIVRSTALDTIEFDIKENTGASSFVYTDSEREVLHNFATELNQINLDLEALFANNKTYTYNGDSITYQESVALRTAVLAVAFKLEYLSAYRFGSDDDLRERKETINSVEYEYMNIMIDPASVINSGNFLKLEDGSRVETARGYAVDALTVALTLPVGFEDIKAEDKTDAQAILDSLNSASTPYVIEPSDDEEIKSISINLNSLYSSAGALSFEDFGSTWQITCDNGYTHDVTKSKMEDEIICVNGSEWRFGDVEPSVDPTSSSSKIDDVIVNITKIENNEVLTGQAVIDFLLEDDVSVVSGKSITVEDSEGTQTMSFHEGGDYTESGTELINNASVDYNCSGSWKELDPGVIAIICDDNGTSAIPDGNIQTNDEMHITLPTSLVVGQSLSIKEWDSNNSEEDSWTIPITVITDL